jgi:signal recognition particle subunit SRP19
LKKPGKVVVWPVNLDSTKSRIEGRKVPKGLSVQTPRLEEINEAANRLSLEAELTPGKSRPSLWWEKGGYAILPRKGTRTSLLRALAGDIKKIRIAKTEREEHNR